MCSVSGCKQHPGNDGVVAFGIQLLHSMGAVRALFCQVLSEAASDDHLFQIDPREWDSMWCVKGR